MTEPEQSAGASSAGPSSELDPELLEILACPETKEPVAPAPADVLAELNRRIADGAVQNRGGHAVAEPLQAALLREDGQRVYPVRDGIPIMLVDEAIDLAPTSDGA